MKAAIWATIFVLVTLLSILFYSSTQAPSWCHNWWLKYDRSCSGWTFFGKD